MESRSENQKYSKKNIIVPNPAVRIIGKNEHFRIEAMTPTGEEILTLFSKKDFYYAREFFQDKALIIGRVISKENPNLRGEEREQLQNISLVLKTILRKFECESEHAGLYGAFAYDFAKNFYKVPPLQKDDGTSDFTLFIPTTVYVFDGNKETGEKVNFYFNNRTDSIEDNNLGFNYTPARAEVTHDLDDAEYVAKINKVIKDIKGGRAMQCVLSRKTSMPLKEPPVESYSKLRKTNPSPYSFFYNLGNNELIYGASPEMHIVIKGGEIEIRPIAGTITRQNDPLDDANARKQLINDEKELSEHTMLVDLARHELHKLSVSETVKVSDLFTIETYPNLYHLVSGVKGTMKKGKDAIDALLVTLPAGTLSGAPKLEAMKMIEEYEGSKRGFYGGAVGLVSFNGNCNTGITIRSVHVKDGLSHIRGGGGIIALSNPEGEYNERKLKLSKILNILEREK